MWLTTSFSLWQDDSYIVTGPNRFGPSKTENNPNTVAGSSGGAGIDPLIFIAIGGAVVIGGGLIYYVKYVGAPSNASYKDVVQKIEKKKTQELDMFSKIITERKKTANNSAKPKPRRKR
jgi:hypothetical protein